VPRRPGGGAKERVSPTVLVIFIGLQLGMIMSTLDGTIVSTALPTISHELGNQALRSWVITSYLLAQVATMPLYGKLGDLYGRKRIFIIAISIFTVGSMLSGAAGSMAQLLASRAIQGVGAGGIGSLAMAIVADIVPARQLGRWLGYQGAIFAVSSLIGPLAGGLFVDNLSWHWAFYVNLPFAAASIFIVATKLHLPQQPIRHALDYAGAAMLTLALACIVLAASLGGESNDWTSPEVIGLAIAVVVLAIAFVARERRAPEPVLPLRLLQTRVVRIAAGLNATSGATFASGIYFIPVFVQQVKGASATESGFLLIPFMFTTAFTTLVAGRAVERTGRYRTWPIVGSVVATGGVLLLTTLGIDTPVWAIAFYGAVLGTGVGFVMQTSLLALQNGAEQRDLGVATSSALLSRILGSTLGVALCSAALQSRLPGGTPGAADYASALPAVYYAALPVTLLMLVLALRLPQLRLRESARFDFDPPGDAAVAH
jgi:EmrB/QacA subfamily drug resistance transporter